MQEAKQQFSEVLRHAHDDGPQIVTKHGREVAVVLDIAEYRILKGEKMSLAQFLLAGPGFDVEIELPEREVDTRPGVTFE